MLFGLFLELQVKPHVNRKALAGEFVPKTDRRRKAGAVAKFEPLRRERLQRGNGLVHPFWGSTFQMRAANERMDSALPGQLSNVFECVDNPRMRAAQDDHEPGGGSEIERLIIQQRVRLLQHLVQIE